MTSTPPVIPAQLRNYRGVKQDWPCRITSQHPVWLQASRAWMAIAAIKKEEGQTQHMLHIQAWSAENLKQCSEKNVYVYGLLKIDCISHNREPEDEPPPDQLLLFLYALLQNPVPATGLLPVHHPLVVPPPRSCVATVPSLAFSKSWFQSHL